MKSVLSEKIYKFHFSPRYNIPLYPFPFPRTRFLKTPHLVVFYTHTLGSLFLMSYNYLPKMSYVKKLAHYAAPLLFRVFECCSRQIDMVCSWD